MLELLGWCSSLVLFCTIVAQIIKQWREGSGTGMPPWLFAGQTAASLGFAIYSALLENWVFTLTNSLMVLSTLFGMFVSLHFKRHPRPAGGAVQGGR